MTPLPARILSADPPWSFGDSLPGAGRGSAKHYDVLSLDALERFSLPPLADDALLAFWRVGSQVEEAYRIVRAWGFVPKSEIVWVKQPKIKACVFCKKKGNDVHSLEPKDHVWDCPVREPEALHMGMGHYVRNAHEVAIVATRGSFKVASHKVKSVLYAPVGAHSEKPAAFYAMLEELGGAEGPYVELFGRATRSGWAVYGNEIEGGRVWTPAPGRIEPCAEPRPDANHPLLPFDGNALRPPHQRIGAWAFELPIGWSDARAWAVDENCAARARLDYVPLHTGLFEIDGQPQADWTWPQPPTPAPLTLDASPSPAWLLALGLDPSPSWRDPSPFWRAAFARATYENTLAVDEAGLLIPSPLGPEPLACSTAPAWDTALARATEEAPVPPDHGPIPPHILDELGFHPALLAKSHQIIVLAQAVQEGFATKEEAAASDRAWAILPYRARDRFFARAIEALRYKAPAGLPVYRSAAPPRTRREQAYVQRALQEGILAPNEGTLGHDRAWTRLGMRIRTAAPGSPRSRFFDEDPGPLDRFEGENLSLLALDLHLRGVPVDLIDLCTWSVVWRDVARTWIAHGGERPPFLDRCRGCETGQPHTNLVAHERGCTAPEGAYPDAPPTATKDEPVTYALASEPFSATIEVTGPEHGGEIAGPKPRRGRPPGSKSKKLPKAWGQALARALQKEGAAS